MITSEPIGADDLRAAVGADAASAAEVLVIAPALHDSPLRFWLSDADAAIERAQCVQRTTVESLDADGIAASGDTGEADTLDALADSLASFPADRIVVFSHSAANSAYREDVRAAEIEARFGVPTTQLPVPH